MNKNINDLEKLINELCSYPYEKEWFEFKENWFEADELGKYISSLANAAAYEGLDFGYLIWGVNNDTHEIVGTSFNPDIDYKNEPLKHFLIRQLKPENNFSFIQYRIKDKNVVILKIPAANKIPLSWKGERFIRIGSSKESLSKYPEKEIKLFNILNTSSDPIIDTPSMYQNLTFNQLLVYYVSKGISLRDQSFKENLGLLTKDGKYNIMAQLLSDDSHMSIRVAIFLGTKKSDPMYTVREFGHKCLLLSVDDILKYGEIINIPQADERYRVVERKEVLLFDIDAYREAIINAFLHNNWIDLNEPAITIYSNRIEILSRGRLAKGQSIEGFYAGKSVPVNKKLADIFLQLHISERTGRGVPRIVESYGEHVFDFSSNDITVTIPFNRINILERGDKRGNKRGDKKPLNENQKKVLKAIIDNPSITKPQIASRLSIGKSTVDRSLEVLKNNNLIERVGSNKTGYWKII